MKIRMLLMLSLLLTAGFAQSGALEGLKANAAKNKAALAGYTWQEQSVLSVDGDAKRTTISRVQLDATGHSQKTLISEVDAPAKDVRGPIRKRVGARKAGDFKDYMGQVMALTQSYAQADPGKLEDAFKAGNVVIDSSAGAGKTTFTIKSYLKPGDTMTVVYDTVKKAPQTLAITSYLDSRDNGVQINATFATLPDGTNHVDQATILGQEKSVKVEVMNRDYARRD